MIKTHRIEATHRLLPLTTALLVVDMQRGFLDKGASLEVPQGRLVVPRVAHLLSVCRTLGVPVIFTEFVYSPQVPCLRGEPFGPEHLPAQPGETPGLGVPSSNCLIGRDAGVGVESSATVDALAPLSQELVLQAHTYDKFYGTPLELALRSLNIDRIMVTGVTTDVCVNSTILSAANRNFRVVAITDGMATIHDHLHTACLQIWENKFARLMTADAAVEELQSSNGLGGNVSQGQ